MGIVLQLGGHGGKLRDAYAYEPTAEITINNNLCCRCFVFFMRRLSLLSGKASSAF